MRHLIQIGFACCMLMTNQLAYPDQLGRLFFSPEQRKKMDYDFARLAKHESDNNRILTLNGIVQRNGGKRTAWINGKPQEVGPGNESAPESVRVTIPGQKKTVRLKVGQRFLLSPDVSSKKTPSVPTNTVNKK